ncbi:MAG: hypothetical protein A2136_09535 [Chloroflexi bacterium RBG_16_54_11]|nr:MAG: hypothetical protein A2136_09535 [Chloroflexi bacterium RBG_16_54_11]
MPDDLIPIKVGCHVELNLLDREGNRERLRIDIVPDESADISHGFLGAGTPLAKSLFGEKAGSVIPYLKDNIFAIEILLVNPSILKPPDDSQERRQATSEKIKREVEHTNARVFASSFSGKWGDYDLDSLPGEEKSEEDKGRANPK